MMIGVNKEGFMKFNLVAALATAGLALVTQGCVSTSVFDWQEVEVIAVKKRPEVCFEVKSRPIPKRHYHEGKHVHSYDDERHFNQNDMKHISHDKLPRLNHRDNHYYEPHYHKYVLRCLNDGYDTLVSYEDEQGNKIEKILLLRHFREAGTIINVPPETLR
jgi:hypothetical protein